MANAGTTPSGFDSSDVSYLQSSLQSDSLTKSFYDSATSTAGYRPDVDYEGPYSLPPNAPARLTDIPTSSTNAARPRTVAAGYDEQRKIITVMFRDGTLINYYDVEPGTWQNFRNSISKGKPWLNFYGDGAPGELVANHRYGPADLSNIDDSTLSEIYRVARSAQVRYTTKRGTVNKNVSNGRGRYAYKPGKNPATAGRKPRKP